MPVCICLKMTALSFHRNKPNAAAGVGIGAVGLFGLVEAIEKAALWELLFNWAVNRCETPDGLEMPA
jgi:hypothetical protein